MEKIFDLPAHPLFVHAPLVLAPLACLGAIAMAGRPQWRRTYRWHLVAATAVVLVAVQLAVSSGQEFDDLLQGAAPIQQHRDLAETTRVLVTGWFAVTLVGAIHGQWVVRNPRAGLLASRAPAVQHVLAGIVAVLGVLVTIWMIRTGHEGSRVVWEGTV